MSADSRFLLSRHSAESAAPIDSSMSIDVLLPEPIHVTTRRTLEGTFHTHFLHEASDPDRLLKSVAHRIRAIARGNHAPIDSGLMQRLPALEIVTAFGVGYDGIDLDYARKHGIIVTNTPDVLSEEVADFTIGLLMMTLRELPKAERYLRSGDWATHGKFAPTRGSLRGRTVGIVGLGRIGTCVARRLDAMQVSVAYHSRNPPSEMSYPYYADLLTLARAVDTLIALLPGGDTTHHLIDAAVLAALGQDGVFINVGRGSTVDEVALIEALRSGTIQAAGLDVYENEPNIDPALLSLHNTVLLPHVGSASMHTHDAMGQLLIENLKSWFENGRPLTPVPETPWPPEGAV